MKWIKSKSNKEQLKSLMNQITSIRMNVRQIAQISGDSDLEEVESLLDSATSKILEKILKI